MVPAAELQQQGYLLSTHQPEELTQASLDLAGRLMKLAPITQRVSKLTLARLMKSNLPDCSDLIAECYGSADFHHGVAAFLAGKPPTWSGK